MSDEKTVPMYPSQDEQKLITDISEQINALLSEHELKLSVVQIIVDGQQQAPQIHLTKIAPKEKE